MRGILIAVEGADGVGKHTQVTMLNERLKDEGYSTKLYSFPDYESDFGRILKRNLVGVKVVNNKTSFLTYLADMTEKAGKIEMDVEAGNAVVLDRYLFSTVAYGTTFGFDYEDAKMVERIFALPQPDVVLYIDMPVETSMVWKNAQRSLEKEDADRYERNRAVQEKVRAIYEKLMEESFMASRWVKIDGGKSKEEVHEAIMKAVIPVFVENRVKC
ncbi:MAG: dTMP kinase [Candidatus Micrarchaeota archaeon]|nr:dTMP kinase [Candidatus Micrarchaeota archaeon]